MNAATLLTPRVVAWDVYLGRRLINTVYLLPSCNKEYVLKALIEHYGMSPSIKVYRREKHKY